MKYLILSSSIFYLLGIKMTENIEISKKVNTDSIQVNMQIPDELLIQKEESDKIFELLKEKDDSEGNKWSNFFFEPKSNSLLKKVE